MNGTIELTPDGAFLVIRFTYREDLVALVKDMPGRRWDPKKKEWRVPAEHAEVVYRTFVRHLFDFAPEISSLLAGTLGTAPKQPSDAAPRQNGLPLAAATDAAIMIPAPADAVSISTLNAKAREVLRGGMAQPIWVVGEIVDFDKQAGRKHLFFTLIEKAPGETRPRAAVAAMLFEREAQALQKKLQAAAEPLTLRDGIEIRALVRVDLYPQAGRFQVIVEDIDASFTLGKLALQREQILRELVDKGLANRNKSLGVPIPPLRIGALSSPESDGWSDFVRHLQDAAVPCEVTLVPVKVQGKELKPDMLAGLQWFADHADEFDLLCILRGGGSRTDLAWFDDRDVAFAVARHPLKVVVGIGHQRDQSVLDAIAHSEKTPTAVAEFIVRGVEQARATVRDHGARLADAVIAQLRLLRTALFRLGRDLMVAPTARLLAQRSGLANAARLLQAGAMLRLQGEGAELRAAAARLRQLAALRLERAHSQLDQQTNRRRLLDPAGVLGRGYALLRDEAGAVLTSATKLQKNQVFVAQLRDGKVRGRTESVQIDPPT